jgi:class 3 adenylate cyclase
MEPRIQYAQTADGVSIAFWTLGEGMPLVHMPWDPWSHIQLEWQDSRSRRWNERLAENRMLVRYDCRGSGLSDRDVTDFSLDCRVLDLEAVVAHLRLEKFVLFGCLHAGPTAVAYAARHPERLSHLVLWCTYARASDLGVDPRVQGLDALAEKDWRLFTDAVTHVLLGWSGGEQARRMAAFLRTTTSQEAYLANLRAGAEFDVTALLRQVRTPTLVLHRRKLPWPEVGTARGLATRIPDARLTVLEGASVMPSLGDTEAVATAIDEFLGQGEKIDAGAQPPAPGAFRTVLFTDIEGSTSLTQRLGDAKARQVLRENERIVRETLKAHGRTEVKTMGDGFMASFSSATEALECAIAMQRAFAEHNESAEEAIRVRIGLNAGEPIAEEADLFGTAVILAARIAAKAEGGEILASDVVRQLVAGKGFLFSDRGDVVLRGFEDPVRLYEVRWREGE